MNVLSFEKRDRPPAPHWRTDDSTPTYFELLVDGLALWEHLVAAGVRNGFEPIGSYGEGNLVFAPDRDETEVGYYNYLCPAGWTRAEWQREWVSWLRAETISELPDGRVPLLICGYCGDDDATTVRVVRKPGGVRWVEFQEYNWSLERLRLPELYAGLEFEFDWQQYQVALDTVVASLS